MSQNSVLTTIINTTANSQQVVLAGGGVAAVSTQVGGPAPGPNFNPPAQTSLPWIIFPTVDCFVRQDPSGAAVALNNGTDQFLKGGLRYAVYVSVGNYLSFNSTAAGTVYLSPGT